MTQAELSLPARERQVRSAQPLLSRIADRLGWLVVRVLLWAFFASVVFPMVWTVLTSFKTSRELFNAPWTLPATPQWVNYAHAWDKMNVNVYLVNSAIVSAASLVAIMAFGATISYALARYDFPGNRVLYFYFVAGMMIPSFLSYIPAWFLHRSLGILGTRWCLIIQYTAGSLGFTVFFLQSFFKTLPKELEESAIMDGASLFTVFYKVMLPLAKSGMLTIAVFNFLGVWNEFMWALVTISRDELKTLPLGMSNLLETAYYATDWGAMFAGFVIMLVPTFAVYAVFQNRLTEGITVGALKG